MTTTPNGARPRGVWTVDAYAIHNEARWVAEDKFQTERDRRYKEVQELNDRLQAMRDREKDRQAIEYERRLEGLNHENARVSANAERSVSAELFESRMKPIETYVANAQGQSIGSDKLRVMIAWIVALLASLIAVGSVVFRDQAQAPQAREIIYTPALPGTLLPSPQGPATAPK